MAQDDIDWGSILQNYNSFDRAFDAQKWKLDLAGAGGDWNVDLSAPDSLVGTPSILTPEGVDPLEDAASFENYFSMVHLMGHDAESNLDLSQVPSLAGTELSRSADMPSSIDLAHHEYREQAQHNQGNGLSQSAKGSSEYNRSGPRPPTARRRTHYAVEQRYRANLNQKILALAAVIPSLAMRQSENNCIDDTVELEGQPNKTSRSGRINKSAVLSSALEYIQELEKRCKDKEELIQKLQESALVAGQHLDAMHRMSR